MGGGNRVSTGEVGVVERDECFIGDVREERRLKPIEFESVCGCVVEGEIGLGLGLGLGCSCFGFLG